MTTPELIKKAIEKLNKVKRLNLTEAGILEQLGKDNVFAVSVIDNENGCTFDTIIDETLTTQQLLPDDPNNLSCDDIILLRIAKHIFEAYKKFKSNLVNGSLTYPSINSIDLGPATVSSTLNVSSIDIGGTTIYSNTITDLEDEVKKLKDENDNLAKQVTDLKAVVDVLLHNVQMQNDNDNGVEI